MLFFHVSILLVIDLRYYKKGEINMKDLILETKNLSKRYGEQMAVNNVSLQIERNSIFFSQCLLQHMHL
ncbi:lantibiotic ABC transporter ATP-binding protein [Clostridioides difficile]|uniref:Lantibiotic ABC transporter ATP-binding protein n=1 Tax=Clostridioides difficile TaxID=1496 RepID=A0AB74QEJ6_CLODI|nr:lantibiotic ABC transporter ATP-binding protein [Clostridioides difficile]AXU30351.1 lantibiotic ABC transporter ATP-binding protein [Clostridioides difficile]AXU34139.1 lantibiotic ABC transporter ATP-binding protein [Clostridioides difficile]OMK73643.1 hypothetical protein BER44_000751 [Clostridioides difficile]SJO14433.1 Uncharacterised protein [Clostridioides difficile]